MCRKNEVETSMQNVQNVKNIRYPNAELFLTFVKIGLFTFGGGFAMLSLIDHECVTCKKWLTPSEMLDLVAVSESTPGPIAINSATYVGYKKNGVTGAIWATFGVVLPSFVILFLISKFFVHFMQYKIVAKAFAGVRIGVAILIIQAAVKMLQTMLQEAQNKLLCATLTALFFSVLFTLNLLQINFSTIYLIIIAGFLGYAIYGIRGNNKELRDK
ncbi:MAG: chromate transporter [Synergistaceae bacterium]|nr:chromate transporter [Synergistaceae bacterium]